MKQVQITRYIDKVKEEVSEYDNWTDEEKKAYIGGVFDSEGSTILCKNSSGYYSNIIQVMTSVDYDHIIIVKKILQDIGHYVNINSANHSKYNLAHKTSYVLKINNRKDIKQFINDLKDFIILKRDQLDTMEKVLNDKLSKSDGHKIMKYLNERGRNASNTNRIVERNYLYFDRLDLAKIYISSLTDVEGWITIYNSRYKNKIYKRARCSIVCSTNLSYVECIKEIVNQFDHDSYITTDIHARNSSAKQSYALMIYKKNTILRLSSIIGNYLILKKPRLQCIINIINEINVEENAEKLRELNKRGAN